MSSFLAYPIGSRIQAATSMPYWPTLIEAREYGTVEALRPCGEDVAIEIKWDRHHDGLLDNTTLMLAHEAHIKPIPLYLQAEKAPWRVPERARAVATLAAFFGLGWLLEPPWELLKSLNVEAAIEFKDAKLLNTIVQRGEPLRVLFTTIQRSECHGTVERVFTRTSGGAQTSWREQLVYHNMPTYLHERLVVMHLPQEFLPGQYSYHAAGLVKCEDGIKYVLEGKPLAFEIVE